MRLLEFLYSDPGAPPEPDYAPNPHMARPEDPFEGFPLGLATSRRVCDQEPLPHDTTLAHLSGRGVRFMSKHDIPRGMGGGQYDGTVYDEREAIRFRHFLSEAVDTTEHEALQLDEILKKGKNVNGAYDTRTIGKLEGDGLPGRAEDGKGFCFHWADGRGVCGFKYKNDALRWLKADPRDVVRFWYGEPLMPNGKPRFKVRERYKADETALQGE